MYKRFWCFAAVDLWVNRATAHADMYWRTAYITGLGRRQFHSTDSIIWSYIRVIDPRKHIALLSAISFFIDYNHTCAIHVTMIITTHAKFMLL